MILQFKGLHFSVVHVFMIYFSSPRITHAAFLAINKNPLTVQHRFGVAYVQVPQLFPSSRSYLKKSSVCF